MIQTLSVFHLNTTVSDLEWKIIFLKQYKTKKGMPVCESDIQLISTRVSMQSMESCILLVILAKHYTRCQNIFTGLTGACLTGGSCFAWHVLGKRLAST